MKNRNSWCQSQERLKQGTYDGIVEPAAHHIYGSTNGKRRIGAKRQIQVE